jgi:hypothetical protein
MPALLENYQRIARAFLAVLPASLPVAAALPS